MNLLLSSIVVWFLFIPVAIINGVVREKIYKPFMSERLAHQISTLIASLAFVLFGYLTLRNRVAEIGTIQLLYIGLLWVGLTVGFEFGFGHFVDKIPTEKLLADYNLLKGRVWSIFLVIIFLTPLFVKLVSSGTPVENTSPLQKNDVYSMVSVYAQKNGYTKPVVTADFVNTNEARGNVNDEGVHGSGAKWFALKIDGIWTVVHLGNGLPQCKDLSQYHVSVDFLQCY